MEFKNQARLMYLLLTFGWILFDKYNSNYLNSFNLSATQIGMINTLSCSLGIFIGPIWGIIMDKFKTPNRLLAIKYLGFPISLSIVQYIIRKQNTYFTLLMCNLLGQLLWYGANEITDALIINTIDNQDKIGQIKFIGSLGMIFGASYGIVATQLGWDYAVLMCVLSLSCLSLFTYVQQPFTQKQNQKSLIKEAKKLLKNRNIQIVYFSSVLFYIYWFVIDCYVWLYFEREFKADMTFIGYCLLAQKIPEIFIAYNTEVFIKRIGYKGMQIMSFIVISLRFLAMSFLTKENYLWLAIFTESLHSLSLIMIQSGSLLLINNFTPKSLIFTSQTLNSSFKRIGSLIGGIMSTPIQKHYGGKLLFQFCSISAIAAAIIYSLTIYIYFDDNQKIQEEEEELELELVVAN